MKVRNLIIYFGYEFGKPSPVSKNLRDVTSCTVENDAKKKVGYGEVSKSKDDRPNQEVARRKALTKAISNFPRDLRSEIWEAYRTLTKVPRWATKADKLAARQQQKNLLTKGYAFENPKAVG
jgi:hypothetical protein